MSRRYVNPELLQANAVMQQAQLQANDFSQQQQQFSQQQQYNQQYNQYNQQIPQQQQVQQGFYAGQSPPPSLPQRQQVHPVFPWGNPKLLNPSPIDGATPLPQYFRTTVSNFPMTKSTADQCGVPLGVIVNPSQVNNVPVIDYSQSQIPRCHRCRAYLSPYSQPTPDGRAWKCPFCGAMTEFSNNPKNQAERSTEFVCPVYDMITPEIFKSTLPGAHPCFVVLIDLSLEAISTGFTLQFINSLKASLDSIDPITKFGIITMSHNLTVFDFERNTEFVIVDLTDPVVPSTPLAKIGSCKETVSQILDNLVEQINAGKYITNGNCFGSALQLAEKVMLGTGGILLASFVGYPTYGPHAMKERPPTNDEEAKLLRLPEDGHCKFYRDIGFILNRASISVHLFCLKSEHQKMTDLAVVVVPSSLTCGSCHYYREFDPMALHNDLFVTLTSEYLWNSSMRLRCSNNIRVINTYSNCTIRDETAFYPVMSAHNAVTFEVQVTGDVRDKSALFQCAVIWTNNKCERLIRIFTFAVPTTNQASLIKSTIDEAACATFYLKRAAVRVLQNGAAEASDYLRKSIASLSAGGHRCESMYHLAHAMLASKLLKQHNNIRENIDDRVENIIQVRSMSMTNALLYLYPQMIAADQSSDPLPLETGSFGKGSCFVVHTINQILIWISPNISQDYLQNVFGVSSADQLPTSLPTIETPQSKQLHEIINGCYLLSGKYLPIEIIPPGSPRESVFSELLVDVIPVKGSNLAAFIAEMTSSLH
ncbi:Sec23/Sec24 trunk domain containing protein [Tritrichomonas foetus]|uniref:Sec23/Sec24 trunk domain containing protein n=1 Tax=Tritrichomonas foetus TaxID=1144522 RepID=A0A1J4KCY5_9EUKA|nr:Sec23/Sec24 trunk domain containing protein [Tritrichomonas foetus]|eukprot:OHT07564.1 Sec23/Sec24 trunk domain containing protein [Tritrichomonas foetus]